MIKKSLFLCLMVQRFFLCCFFFCFTEGYWEIVMESLPQISGLDGLDRLRHPSSPGVSSLCDIPSLDDYVDFLLSSDTSHSEAVIYHFIPVLVICTSFSLTLLHNIVITYDHFCAIFGRLLYPGCYRFKL